MAVPSFINLNLNSALAGPRFITGEPRREWDFQFRLMAPVLDVKNAPAWTRFLWSPLPLLYVSGLAEKINLPNDKFDLGQAQLSALQMPFPKGFQLPSFSVQYLEDEIGSVYAFHRIWMSNIRGYMDNGDEGGGVVFEELGKVCASAIYAPSKKIPLPVPVDVPLGGDLWPAVFPVDVARDAANRGGNNISKVTVTYARVPVWSMGGAIFLWMDKGGNSKTWVSGSWSASAG
jgi:hypothetical protein